MNEEKERKMDQDELWAKTFEPYMDSIDQKKHRQFLCQGL